MAEVWQDVSGVIPGGGTVVVMPQDFNRRGAVFANTDATHSMTVTVGNTPFPVAAGGTLTLPLGGTDAKFSPANPIKVTGTAAATYSAAYW